MTQLTEDQIETGKDYLMRVSGRVTPIRVKVIKRVYEPSKCNTLGSFWSCRDMKNQRVHGYTVDLSPLQQLTIFDVGAV